jgi:predicted DNA-binding protein
LNNEKKLVIQPQKYGGETSVVSMRMPKNMLADIEKVATETGRTRNDILMMSLEFALEHMEIKKIREA